MRAYCGVCGKYFWQTGLKYVIFFVIICRFFGIFNIWESIMVLDDKIAELVAIGMSVAASLYLIQKANSLSHFCRSLIGKAVCV